MKIKIVFSQKKKKKTNQDWNGKTLKNIYIINESTMNKSNQDEEMTTHKNAKSHYDGLKSEDFLGTFVDRKCSKCGHEGMTFSTR
jgi:DNA-directed RNA polymerase subunit M/transcription elongation factor TFIIS